MMVLIIGLVYKMAVCETQTAGLWSNNIGVLIIGLVFVPFFDFGTGNYGIFIKLNDKIFA